MGYIQISDFESKVIKSFGHNDILTEQGNGLKRPKMTVVCQMAT